MSTEQTSVSQMSATKPLLNKRISANSPKYLIAEGLSTKHGASQMSVCQMSVFQMSANQMFIRQI